jgi:putative alpha-1,2-mannosidase
LHLENGKDFIIDAPANSDKNIYIKQAILNGQEYGNNWLSHTTILQGGSIHFRMTDTVDKTRGTIPAAFPYSFSNDKDKTLFIK